jgi:hypothetical protein
LFQQVKLLLIAHPALLLSSVLSAHRLLIGPNTYIDSVAEIRKKLILMRWPSLRLQNERNASWAEEAEPMKCP